MSLADLVNHAVDKERFHTLDDYIAFCALYLEFAIVGDNGLQAQIVSQNEGHYQFFQYREDGSHNITRPINTRLMYTAENFMAAAVRFRETFEQLRAAVQATAEMRENLIRVIYTVQQSIGAALDALPAGQSNRARKVNGDLFERFIRVLITSLEVSCVSGTMQVPVRNGAGIELFKASYQHDLLLSRNNELKIIGSVKTSSKDRIDKVFMDKFLYNRLTETALRVCQT